VYDIQKGARLPEEGWQPRVETEAAFGREEALIKWLVEGYFPGNPGSRFVSATELRRMAKTSVAAAVSRGTLAAAADDLLGQWARTGNYPPTFARAGNEYFSLADMFQMLASALAGWQRAGVLPESVRLAHIYGPLEMTEEEGPREGTVTVSSVTRVAAELAGKLNNQEWKPLPDNIIPTWVTVDGVRLNAAQFLRLMAEALASPQPDARLKVRNSYMFSAVGEGFPRTRPRSDIGAAWTIKPARLGRPE
jgi:hypothetical protein